MPLIKGLKALNVDQCVGYIQRVPLPDQPYWVDCHWCVEKWTVKAHPTVILSEAREQLCEHFQTKHAEIWALLMHGRGEWRILNDGTTIDLYLLKEG